MVTAIVMIGERQGESQAVSWVQGARRAAACDLIDQLRRQPKVERILLVAPEEAELPVDQVDRFVLSVPGAVHVGRLLAELVEEERIQRLLYFGGGSAPLLPDETIGAVAEQLAASDRLVLTNNQFASDWAAVAPAPVLAQWIDRLPRDNMLGWVLSAEAGLPSMALPASAATRLDIDTPIDLLALALHPATGSHLRRYLDSLPLNTTPLEEAVNILATPASRVFLAGRIGPDVWSALNRATRSWLRVVAEERGMVSSGRQARGEVRSLLAAHIEAVGMEAFFTTLGEWADAAFIDSRVLLAHHNLWPGNRARFASDLGQAEDVDDPWLRAFTVRAAAAPIPVILGGHGLLSGVIYALVDLLQARRKAD